MNVVALIQPRVPNALESIAEYINDQFARMDRAEARSKKAWLTETNAKTTAANARVRAGLALIDARRKLKGEDPRASFAAWCDANIQRSRQDCSAVIRLAETRERIGCMSLVTGHEVAVWDRRSRLEGVDDDLEGLERAKWREAKAKLRAASGHGQDGDVHDHGKRVQSMLGMYRNCSLEEREDFKRGMEEIDNAEC